MKKPIAILSVLMLSACSSAESRDLGSIDNTPSLTSTSSHNDVETPMPTDPNNVEDSTTKSSDDDKVSTENIIKSVMTGTMSSVISTPEDVTLGKRLHDWRDKSDRNEVWVSVLAPDTKIERNGNEYTLSIILKSAVTGPGESIESAGNRAYSYVAHNLNSMEYQVTNITVVYDENTHTLELKG